MKPLALRDLAGAVVLIVLSAGAPSCSRASQAEACAADRQELAAAVERDQHLGAMLHEVDSLAGSGKGVEAANRIDKAVRPELARTSDEASQLHMRTRWGLARQKQLRALLDARAASLSDYADALRSDRLDEVVEAMTAQRDIEKRAMEVQKAIGSEPDSSTGECAAP